MRRGQAVVWGAAAVSVALRFPGLVYPLRADEAGFLLVARNWHPEPESLYGTYWVDRPPPVIALTWLADAIGGPTFLRWVAAGGCVALVLLTAAVARRIGGDAAAPWAAVTVACLVSTPRIDAIAAKGEVLGIPLVMLAVWLALLAHDEAAGTRAGVPREGRAALLAAASGASSLVAVGLKQNLVGGLAFAGVLLLGGWLAGRYDGRRVVRLAVAALAGAAIPVLATVTWTLLAGVDLQTLWYQSFGMRREALEVIASASTEAPGERVRELLDRSVQTGLLPVLLLLPLCLDVAWRRDRVLTLAVSALLAVDVAGLLLGGSYWPPYLLNLVPAAGLVVGMLAGMPRSVARSSVVHGTVVFVALSALNWAVHWSLRYATGDAESEQAKTGAAVGEVAEPGDTLVVYGGRADIQFASGLSSPYEHLWSLPMRTLDPELEQLTSLLISDEQPTWVVEAIPLDSWQMPGHDDLRRILAAAYVPAGEVCGFQVHHLRGLDRNDPVDPCTP
jgi:hypothetical protein